MIPRIALAMLSLCLASPAFAQQKVALIESVSGTDAVAAFSLVAEGDVIDLGTDGQLVLGYFDSCRREQITGGTVTVGSRASRVIGGGLSAETLPCGAAKVVSLGDSDVGGADLRRMGAEATPDQAATEVFSTQPAFLVNAGTEVLTIQGETIRQTLDIPVGDGPLVDLATLDHTLSPGQLYRVIDSKNAQFFKVAARAKPGGAGLFNRLVRLIR